MWLGRFLKSNVIYIIWFAFYFTIAYIIALLIFGEYWQSFWVVAVIYAVSISVALSPIGEAILRFSEGCKPPRTEQDRNYLVPIFQEVFEDAKAVNPKLNSGMKIYITDALYVNAFAVGRQTIAVTRGALATFNRDELKGLIAHEIGHMAYGHTKALLLNFIGNFLFTVIVFVSRLLLKITEIATTALAFINIVGIAMRIIAFFFRAFFEISLFLFVNIGAILLSLNSRTNELEADKFAFRIGYGQELIATLYILQKISLNAKMKFSERLKASHPHTTDRIAQLERFEERKHKLMMEKKKKSQGR